VHRAGSSVGGVVGWSCGSGWARRSGDAPAVACSGRVTGTRRGDLGGPKQGALHPERGSLAGSSGVRKELRLLPQVGGRTVDGPRRPPHFVWFGSAGE